MGHLNALKVAAYQAPLCHPGSFDALARIRRRVEQCELAGIAILCCPEAVVGGLADYAEEPARFAIPSANIGPVLATLASDTVTTIVGLSEIASDGTLYNSAAVLRKGAVAGVYRKNHPAITRSVYQPGSGAPVFKIEGLTFGIVICYDSTFPELARRMTAQGATVLFVPSNNGLPGSGMDLDVVADSRACDVARATENRVWVVRADVAGVSGGLAAAGSSEIVAPTGSIVAEATAFSEDFLVAEIRQ
jgi:5-aminopentanamidase